MLIVLAIIISGTELNSLGSTLDELETDLSYKGNVYHSLPDSSSDRSASVTAEDTDTYISFHEVWLDYIEGCFISYPSLILPDEFIFLLL